MNLEISIKKSFAKAIFTCVALCAAMPEITIAQTGLSPAPTALQRTIQEEYQRLSNPEVSFEKYQSLRAVDSQLRIPFGTQRTVANAAQCTNGDFEPGLNTAVWGAMVGTTSGGTLTLSPSLLSPGVITNPAARQTEVSGPGFDPYAPLLSVTPSGSGKAMRIGNAVNGYGAEALTKTFTVSSSTVAFKYAVVFENPVGHGAAIQPKFRVRVMQGTTDVSFKAGVPRANLNAGSNVVISDPANPFLKKSTVMGPNGEAILYKDWTCLDIDLSDLVGQIVTLEFITEDCGAGGHAGWAYIDDLCVPCGASDQGTLQFNAAASTNCGPGKLCFDYTVPLVKTAAGNQTGSATITLEIIQSGVVVHTLNGTRNANGQICFDIVPSAFPASVNQSLGGFDYVATATFTIGSYTGLSPKFVGTKPQGVVAGANNDYAFICPVVNDPNASTCCPPVFGKDMRNMFTQGAHPSGQGYAMTLNPASVEFTTMTAGNNAYLALLKFVCPTVVRLNVVYSLHNVPAIGGSPMTPTYPASLGFMTASFAGGAPTVTQGSPSLHAFVNQPNVPYGIQAHTFGVDAQGRAVNCGFASNCDQGDRFTYSWSIGSRTAKPGGSDTSPLQIGN